MAMRLGCGSSQAVRGHAYQDQQLVGNKWEATEEFKRKLDCLCCGNLHFGCQMKCFAGSQTRRSW